MTPEQLDEIEKLAEAATPGPWGMVVDEFHADSGAHQVALHDCFSEQDAEKNAVFIQAMREHALPLVKALREARERDEQHFKAMEQYRLEVEDYRRRMGTLIDQLAKEEADAHQLTKERDKARDDLAAAHRRFDVMEEEYLKACKMADEARAERDKYKAALDAELPAAWREDIESLNSCLERIGKERDEARDEVERLREAVRQVHALADEAVVGTAVGAYLRMTEIHKITKGMVE